MTVDTLYIELFQPYAQYRNPFTFYYAQTYPLPPKSTIVGMLQNAVGDWYGNKHGLDAWWSNLKISVHGGFESYFWNYQQLIKGDLYLKEGQLWNKVKVKKKIVERLVYNANGIKAQRTPVYQQELFNGRLFIFLRGDKDLLNEIKDALEKPKKVLYLGRSEDIIFIRKVEFEPAKSFTNVKGDLRLQYPTYLKADGFPIKNQKYPVYSIPVKVVFKNNGVPVKHKAEITKKTVREVDFKRVIYTGTDYPIILSGELSKVEFFDIDERKFLIIEEFGWL